MNIWAVLPMKNIEHAKSRLSAVLSDEERREMVLSLYENTLAQIKHWNRLSGILIVSADPVFRPACDETHIHFLQEENGENLNKSIRLATETLKSEGADAMLVIHGDMPLINQNALSLLLNALPKPGVGIIPDRHEKGTNVLLAAPPDVIDFHFGENSLEKHKKAAIAANCPLIIIKDADLAIDIDTIDDLDYLQKHTPIKLDHII